MTFIRIPMSLWCPLCSRGVQGAPAHPPNAGAAAAVQPLVSAALAKPTFYSGEASGRWKRPWRTGQQGRKQQPGRSRGSQHRRVQLSANRGRVLRAAASGPCRMPMPPSFSLLLCLQDLKVANYALANDLMRMTTHGSKVCVACLCWASTCAPLPAAAPSADCIC